MATQPDNTNLRTQQIKVHDDQEQQRVEAHGRFGERYGLGAQDAIPRIQDYGLTSHPPNGSQGMITNLDGNPDKAMVHGMEHPKHRPKNLAEGEVKIYEMWEGFQHLTEDEWHWKVGPCEMWFKRSGDIRIKVGSAIIDMDQGGTVHINP